MASATASFISKFHDFSDEHINSLIDDAIPKTQKKQLLGEYLFWKVSLWILNFSFKLVEVLSTFLYI